VTARVLGPRGLYRQVQPSVLDIFSEDGRVGFSGAQALDRPDPHGPFLDVDLDDEFRKDMK
jgi:hypothetical protein